MVQYMDYQKKTAEQLRQEAENHYNPLFNQEKQSLEQRTQQMLQGLEGQRGGIDRAYNNRLEELKEMIGQSRTNAGNEALSRGFGRSTYVQDKLSDIDQKGTKATDGLEYDRSQEHIGLDSRIGQLNSQLADSISRLDMDKASKIADMLRQLQSEDYQNYTGAMQYNNSLKMQQQQQALAQQQFAWQQQKYNDSLQPQVAQSTPEQEKSYQTYMDYFNKDVNYRNNPESLLKVLQQNKESYAGRWGEGLYNQAIQEAQARLQQMPQIESQALQRQFVSLPDTKSRTEWLNKNAKALSREEYEYFLKLNKQMSDNAKLF